jgi:hypothetical protein
MSTEEMLLTELRRLPERQRERLLHQIDQWIKQNIVPQPEDVQRAVAAVETTWASLSLDPETLRWIAEDNELEYDLG